MIKAEMFLLVNFESTILFYVTFDFSGNIILRVCYYVKRDFKVALEWERERWGAHDKRPTFCKILAYP